MIGIVEADGNEILHVANAGAELRFPGHGLHALEVRLADLGEAARCEHGAIDILHEARQIADFSIVTDDAGFLAAGRAIADELH